MWLFAGAKGATAGSFPSSTRRELRSFRSTLRRYSRSIPTSAMPAQTSSKGTSGAFPWCEGDSSPGIGSGYRWQILRRSMLGGGNWTNGSRIRWKPSANLWCLSRQERAWFSGMAAGAPVTDELSDFRGLCSVIDFRRQRARRLAPSRIFVLTTLLACALTPVVASPILLQGDNSSGQAVGQCRRASLHDPT